MRQRVLSWLLVFGLGVGAVDAQDSALRATAGDKHGKSAKPRALKHKRKNTQSHPPSAGDKTQRLSAAPQPGPLPQPAAAGVDQTPVHKEGDTEIKTLEFSGLDIEGQQKSPQMLYFLKRVRAEFERPRLPHRSFMPELARSTKERDF